jgi:hypothetical protein
VTLSPSQGASQWDPPLQQDSPSSQARKQQLPEGWTTIKDPASGSVYYYNRHTGESTWDMPTEPTPVPKAASPVVAKSPRPETQSTSAMQVVESSPVSEAKAALPSGWVAMVDEGSGTTYYFAPETGDVSWDPPTAAAAAAHAEPPATSSIKSTPTPTMTLEPLQRLPPG